MVHPPQRRVTILFFLKHLLGWLDRHGYIAYTGHVPTYGSLGNAFLELQSLAEPQKKYVIEMRIDQEDSQDEDGEAEPPTPVTPAASLPSEPPVAPQGGS